MDSGLSKVEGRESFLQSYYQSRSQSSDKELAKSITGCCKRVGTWISALLFLNPRFIYRVSLTLIIGIRNGAISKSITSTNW